MRNPHLSLEGIVSLGMDRSRSKLDLNGPTEVIPNELDSEEYRSMLSSFIEEVDRIRRKLR